MQPYRIVMIAARCGCRFLVGTRVVCQEVKPGVFELVAQIPEVAHPETSAGWIRKNVIEPHESSCPKLVDDGLQRLRQQRRRAANYRWN